MNQQDKWDTESIYENLSVWEEDLAKTLESDTPPFWPSLASFQGRLGEGEKTIKEFLDASLLIARKLEKLYTYAHLKHDENITVAKYKASNTKMMSLFYQFQNEISWFEPELLALPQTSLDAYLQSEELSPYHTYLEKIVRLKPHTLSSSEERLMALSGPSLITANKTFSAINDADFKFPSIEDSEGQEHKLTHGQYSLFLRSRDRFFRKNAFQTYHKQYKNYQNTLSELLFGTVNNHLFIAKARNYETCLESALYPHEIPVEVYDSLIETVSKRVGSLHRYISLRKKVLELDEYHLYDQYVPLQRDVELKMDYHEAAELIGEAASPLGEEYQAILREGLTQKRWVDKYEVENKRSGAYSSGCYDTMPYILMNYKGLLRDAFTLAHEAGHSMHSNLSRKHQPYHYADYTIFLAEVASTFNEELFMQLLLQQKTKKEEQIFLLNQKLEDIRGTLFRQTMFAEFELKIHQLAEQRIPFTPELLNEEYRKLNIKYYGPDLIADEEGNSEWARIPHFYYNFYVYQYATGISAALALADRVLNGGEKEREAYLAFLKGGSSRPSIDLLRDAGVDMTTPEPVNAAIDTFDRLLDQLENLLYTN